MDSLLLEVIQAIDDLDLGTTKAVQIRNDQLVLLTEHGKAGTQLMPLIKSGGAADLLKEDLLAPCRP